MNPASLEKITIILFILSGLLFLAAVFYSVKFKVVSSVIFELEQKKKRKLNGEPDFFNIQNSSSDIRISENSSSEKLTGTVSVRKKTADVIRSSEIISEVNITAVSEDSSVTKTMPASRMKKNSNSEVTETSSADTENIPKQMHTVAVRKPKKSQQVNNLFTITEEITVIPCSADDIASIDNA